MRVIKKSKFKLDKNIYDTKHYCVITTEKYWDGGIDKSATLSEKAEFYALASIFADIIKEIVIALGGTILTGNCICERGTIFEIWRDKKYFDCFYNLSEYFKDNRLYELKLPDDNEYIDYIVENNFRYLTCFDLLISNKRIILEPTCHTEIFIYACDDDYEEIKNIADSVVKKYEKISVEEVNEKES